MDPKKLNKTLHGIYMEIEKARTEEQWGAIPALLHRYNSKMDKNNSVADCYGAIVAGECQLELYVASCKALKKRTSVFGVGGSVDGERDGGVREGEGGRRSGGEGGEDSLVHSLSIGMSLSPSLQLQNAKMYFQNALEKDPKNEEALLLLGRCCILGKMFEDALKNFKEVNMDVYMRENLKEMSPRLLNLRIQGLAYFGATYEKLASAVEGHREEYVDLAIKHYAMCEDLSVKGVKQFGRNGIKGSAAIEMAMYRGAVLDLGKGNVKESLNRFRRIAYIGNTIVSSYIRVKALEHIAEINLKCSNTVRFTPVEPSLSSKGYVPQGSVEEAILCLLLLVEDLGNKELVSRNDKETLLLVHKKVTSVYSQLVVALTQKKEYGLLLHLYEQAMQFSFEESFLWFQFALVLSSCQETKRALLVLKECLVFSPSNVDILFNAVKLCLGSMEHKLEMASEYSDALVSILIDNNLDGDWKDSESVFNRKLLSRAYMCVGLSLKGLSAVEPRHDKKKCLQKSCLSSLTNAYQLDENSHINAFYCSLMFAEVRELPKALKYVRRAIALNPTDTDSIHLLALLLSAKNLYTEAVQACDTGLLVDDFNFGLMLTKAKLLINSGNMKAALGVFKSALTLWRDVFGEEAANSNQFPRRILFRMSISTGLSHEAQGVAKMLQSGGRSTELPSGFGDGTSNVKSLDRSTQILSSRMTSHDAGPTGVGSDLPLQYALLTKIWLSTAQCYLTGMLYNDAAACIEEAATLSPHSPSVYYFRGLLAEQQNDVENAQKHLEMALALQPDHVDSLVTLGSILLERGKIVNAEKQLSEALEKDFTSHKAWYMMGNVLEKRGHLEKANDCFLMALSLEDTAPIVPFDTVPKPI
eukprot:Nk52_evm13s292 gene=Nk52_evmTU13s292